MNRSVVIKKDRFWSESRTLESFATTLLGNNHRSFKIVLSRSVPERVLFFEGNGERPLREMLGAFGLNDHRGRTRCDGG